MEGVGGYGTGNNPRLMGENLYGTVLSLYNSFINQLKIEDCNLKMIGKDLQITCSIPPELQLPRIVFIVFYILLHVPLLTFQSRTKI